MREFQLAASYDQEGNVPGALQRLRVALDLYPENFRAHILLGTIHAKRNDFEAAEVSLREALQILEEREDGGGSAMAIAQNALGTALSRQERYDEAIPLLRASAADPLNTSPHLAWYNLGEAHYEREEYGDAVEALEQATESNPRFCLAFYLMGKTQFAMEQFEPADESLTRALEVDERCDAFQEAWKLRGDTRARLGDREGAIHDFERCVSLGERTDAGRACKRLLEAD